MAQVALEAGNSPGMIFKHYRELVRPAVGRQWFTIVPRATDGLPGFVPALLGPLQGNICGGPKTGDGGVKFMSEVGTEPAFAVNELSRQASRSFRRWAMGDNSAGREPVGNRASRVAASMWLARSARSCKGAGPNSQPSER